MQAATELLLEHGYARTSLVAVADRAGVSPRTVYVRFAGKAELLTRVIDVAVVGDVDEVPLAGRDWMQRAMTSPTFDERVAAFVEGAAAMQRRLAPLVAVALEVESSEPAVAAQASRARTGTLEALRGFWGAAAGDGLLPPGVDVDWVAETAAVLASSEAAVLRGRLVGEAGYDVWLARVLRQLARPETPPETPQEPF